MIVTKNTEYKICLFSMYEMRLVLFYSLKSSTILLNETFVWGDLTNSMQWNWKKKSIYVHLFQLFYTASVRVLRTGLKGLIHNSEAANSCIPHLGINKMKLENKRKKRRWNKRGFFSRPSRLYSVGAHKKRFEKNIL